MDVQESITIRKAVINQAISYIFEHLDEDITVEDVAVYCCYSKYHFTRMFKEEMDEALYQFIKRIRLERSAWRLKVEKGRSVTEIGGEYGYSSSNFATAFKKHLALSPEEYRKVSEQLVEESTFSHGVTLDEVEDAENRITVGYLKPFTVIYERKKGNLSAAKVIFGAEPKDYEVQAYIQKYYFGLKFSPVVSTAHKETKINPKRMQRVTQKQMQETGIGTRKNFWMRYFPLFPFHFWKNMLY